MWTRIIAGALLTLNLGVATAANCQEPLFVDAIAEQAWVNLDVSPAQGTAGVREALRNAQRLHPQRPVRIRLAPGHYADNLGGEIFAQRLQRGPSNPVLLQATDHQPNATVLGHGINLLGVSYLAIDGVTIGPATVGAWNGSGRADPQPLQAAAGIQVAGAALHARTSALKAGALDTTVYGRFEPSHHVVVRRVTVQNLFNRDERDAETSESQSMDGMKFNQVQDLWVLDSTVSQTTRHGIDNVGVHRAAFCRNLVSQTGGGLGIEAKGGSVDVLYESNTFYRVRRVELGGEETDATYYFSADGRWDYEALRTVARNNLIVDARQAALEFSGCIDCAAVGNTILFTAAYRPPVAGGTIYGGDAIRVHDSRVLGAADGAGSDCQTWDAAAQDYVTVDPCWGVGSRAPAPVNRVLRSDNVLVANNLFVSERPMFVQGTDATKSCPLNVIDGTARLSFDGNYWWNGGQGVASPACSTLPEGSRSRLPGAGASAPPLAGTAVDATTLARLGSSIIAAAWPRPTAPLTGMQVSPAQMAAHDRLGAPRSGTASASVGAIVGADALSDRVFNVAERLYPHWFGAGGLSQWLQGYYLRYSAATQTYIGSAGGRLYVLGPAFGPQLLDLGPLGPWLTVATEAGH